MLFCNLLIDYRIFFILWFQKKTVWVRFFVLFCESARTRFATQKSQKFLTFAIGNLRKPVFYVRTAIFLVQKSEFYVHKLFILIQNL